MAHITFRQLRIIPGSATAAPSATCERRFNFAALARGRKHRGSTTRIDTQALPDSDAGLSPAQQSGSYSDAAPHVGNATIAPTASFDEPLDGNPVTGPATCSVDTHESFEHVRHAITPVVSVIFERQERALQIVSLLTREIGTFCSDRAIVSAGNWEVQVPLDPELLPHTTLHVALSRFNIRIRFDVPDGETRDLLLKHSVLLERELDKVMRSWGEARDIHLSVW
ncbi:MULTISPECIES: type III secretion system protein SctP [Burkholderia]|uniref:type III secretion system protein SctP n=1 Tax=Burkholderia TaxID=32008 RepID=UPI00157AAAB1|nr:MULTISPECIES: type III secretion system protein SctP [Burkholderia]MCU9952149.1 type III secretion system protein SctP [Burkholderia sp. BKH01]NTY37488.1 type III secretion protein HpaP [Burkholderia diffusa]